VEYLHAVDTWKRRGGEVKWYEPVIGIVVGLTGLAVCGYMLFLILVWFLYGLALSIFDL